MNFLKNIYLLIFIIYLNTFCSLFFFLFRKILSSKLYIINYSYLANNNIFN